VSARRPLGSTGLAVFPLCLGTNVFGWTADEPTSFEVLDAYVAAGGNFLDTADVYMSSAPGNSGGESETIIGNWLAARGNRDEIIIATKYGMLDGVDAIDGATARRALTASLERLQTDYVDVYYVHSDDGETSQEDTLSGLNDLVQERLVRHIAASNYGAERLQAALELSAREGWARFEALEPRYSLLDRSYEDELRPICEQEGLACVPYHVLARGFLTGKYRRGGPDVDSPRAGRVREHMNDRDLGILDAVERVAGARGVPIAAVALAWASAQPTVAAPIASARNTDQLADLLEMVQLELTADELRALGEASS
jgi:aryl-alcohol dehydrogenase-like predicted oxidoreductase